MGHVFGNGRKISLGSKRIISPYKSRVSDVDVKGSASFFFEPNRRPAAIACQASWLHERLPLAKVVFFVYSLLDSFNKKSP